MSGSCACALNLADTKFDKVNTRPRSRVLVYSGLVGGVCLAVWFQFQYFKAHSDGESSVKAAEISKPLTAQERARRAMEAA